MRRFRYPRTQPFQDDELDQRSFFGRELEVTELLRRVLSTSLLVVYGKSGLGKTSLLQAGLFPALRARNWLPISVRLDQVERSPIEIFQAEIDKACKAQGVDYTPGAGSGLWEFFKTAVFWRQGELQTPVLFLDQFEELFTLHSPKSRKALINELGELMAHQLPESVRARLEAGEHLPYSHKPPAVKVVLSLRESYLGALEELTTELPQVLADRYRLLALDRSNATRAIVEPARLDQALGFRTPPFEYTEHALQEMLEFLGGKDGAIEPFVLQLLCAHIERELVVGRATPDPQSDITISREDLGGHERMRDVLETFWHDVISGLPERRQRRRAERLCEEGLLNPDGRRRLEEEAQIFETFRVSRETLAHLVDERLVRVERRLGSNYYELSHDRVADAVNRSRRWRMPRRWRVTLAAGGFAVLLLFSLVAANAWRVERNKNEVLAIVVEKSIFEVSDDLRRIGQLQTLKPVAEKRLASYAERASRSAADLSEEDWDAFASASFALGDISESEGRDEDALDFYSKAADIWGRLAEGDPDPSYRERLAKSHERLGRSHNQLGERNEARREFQKALEILDELIRSNPQNDKWQYSLAWILIYLGDLHDQDGYLEGAQKSYESARERLAQQTKTHPGESDLQYGLAAAEQRLGNVHLARMELDEAARAYDSLHQIVATLSASKPEQVFRLHGLFVSHVLLGAVYMVGFERLSSLMAHGRAPDREPDAERDLEKAQEHYADAEETLERLVEKDPDTIHWQWSRVSLAVALGNLAEASGDWDEARSRYQEARKIAHALDTQKTESAGNLEFVIDAELAAGRLFVRDGEIAEARAAFEKAHKNAVKRAEISKDESRWRATVADSLDGLGDVYFAERSVEEARDSYTRALKIREDLVAAAPDHALWKLDLVVSLYKLASLEAMTGQGEGPARLRRAQDILDELAQEKQLPVFVQILAERVAKGRTP